MASSQVSQDPAGVVSSSTGSNRPCGKFTFGAAALQLQKSHHQGDRLGPLDQELRREGVIFAQARVGRSGRSHNAELPT